LILGLGGLTTPPPAGTEEMIERGVSLGTLILGLFVSVGALFKGGQAVFLSEGFGFEQARTTGLTAATGAALVFVGSFVRP